MAYMHKRNKPLKHLSLYYNILQSIHDTRQKFIYNNPTISRERCNTVGNQTVISDNVLTFVLATSINMFATQLSDIKFNHNDFHNNTSTVFTCYMLIIFVLCN